jgi:phosphoribosylanthranilate isomerase
MKKIAATDPDIMGFIFYSGSPRYMGNHLTPEDLKSLPPYIIRTGVFVDESCEEILRIAKLYELNGVQLHGSESPESCKVIGRAGYPVLKAFRVNDDFSFEQTEAYSSVCRFFVFDAFGDGFGGNGIRFNWEKLQSYKGDTEFLLSGGIEAGDVVKLKDLKHPRLAGFDINSKFEIQPGEKDVAKVKRFIAKLRS